MLRKQMVLTSAQTAQKSRPVQILSMAPDIADQVIANANKPAKASVKEAKQTGAKTVSVVFDRDVDTAKATLALTKGTASIASTTKWSEDKNQLRLH